MEEENKISRRPKGPRGMRVAEKAKDFKGSIKRLVSELKEHKIIIVALFLAMLSSILSIFAPNRLSDLTNEISKGLMQPIMNMDEVKRTTLLLVGLYVCSSLFNYIQAICMTTVSNKFAKSLRSKISSKINKLPLKYFDKHQTGDI